MKRIVVVGVGALGSHFTLLARNFDAKLTVVDFDRIESKNIMSQFHTKMGQGKNKAKALQQSMQGLFKTTIDVKPVRVTKDNIVQVLGGASLIVDCTDNFEARVLLQEYCSKWGAPCIHGCLSADGTLARMIWTEHFTADEEGEEGQATCEDGANLPFHGIAAGMLAQIAQKYINTGVKQSYQMTPYSILRVA